MERLILYAELELEEGWTLHMINIHLKSKIPSNIRGQRDSDRDYIRLSAAGWAEGYFLSSMKRVGQALETRQLVDQLFDKQQTLMRTPTSPFVATLTRISILSG